MRLRVWIWSILKESVLEPWEASVPQCQGYCLDSSSSCVWAVSRGPWCCISKMRYAQWQGEDSVGNGWAEMVVNKKKKSVWLLLLLTVMSCSFSSWISPLGVLQWGSCGREQCLFPRARPDRWQSLGKMWPTSSIIYKVLKEQPHWLVSVLAMVAFVLQGQGLAVMTETVYPQS